MIALDVILLEVVIIVKNDPSQNSKEKQKSKKWQDEKLGRLVKHLCKDTLEVVIQQNISHTSNIYYGSGVSISVFPNWPVH